jgi:malonyl-CoA O-methyltransferase
MAGDEKIIAAFDAAARSYDAWTQVQREVAHALVARANGTPATILDLGAGTGHVAGFARKQWPGAKIAALDAAPNMLARLKAKYPEVETIRADAETFATDARYDLILSSMALHWMSEPASVLRRWRRRLAPGGAMHVAIPVAGSLDEWRVFLRGAGLDDSLWPFPAQDFAGDIAASDIVAFPARFDSAFAFARSLKQSGARRAAPGSRPLPAPALRKTLAARPGPFTATFRVAFLRIGG